MQLLSTNICLVRGASSISSVKHNSNAQIITKLRSETRVSAKVKCTSLTTIRVVWSESCRFWIADDAKFLHVVNEDSNQIARMRRLILVFIGRTCQTVRLLTFRSYQMAIHHMMSNARKSPVMKLRTTQVLISLRNCNCAGWSGPLLSV